MTAGGVVWTDDTPIAVLAPWRGRTREARFWVYAHDPRPWDGTGPPVALYRRSPDRKGERPRGHLAGFAGWMHADAYPGHDALARPKGGWGQRITRVACWARAWRKLFEVLEATKSPVAEEAPARIGALYPVEAETNGLEAARPPARRPPSPQQAAAGRASGLDGWAAAQALREAALGRALQYALGRWDALTRYAEDGRLSIDNSHAERLLRGIAVTRKNYLFLGSDAGGERAAVIYTLAETAKLNGLDPEACIATVLDRRAHGHTAGRLDDLLPWKVQLSREAA